MKKNVRDFYRNFDFEKIITNPPQLIQQFLDGEIEFISNNIEPCGEILEVGCGYGRLLGLLANKANKVVGSDFSEPLLQKAQKRFEKLTGIELAVMRAENMAFTDARFDYVLCLDATFGNMPYLEEKVMKEMSRVVKQSGEVVVSVFSENAKELQLENYKRVGLTGIKDDGIAVHSDEGLYSRRFTKQQLRNLFGAAGLSCEITSICSINYIARGRKI